MISLTSQTINVALHEDLTRSQMGEMAARVSRTATLDGGSVLVHSGVSHTDRTLKVRADVSASQEGDLQTVFTSETDIRLSCRDGFFAGAIQKLNRNHGRIELDFWPTSKIA